MTAYRYTAVFQHGPSEQFPNGYNQRRSFTTFEAAKRAIDEAVGPEPRIVAGVAVGRPGPALPEARVRVRKGPPIEHYYPLAAKFKDGYVVF
jgi:hypothetical protein